MAIMLRVLSSLLVFVIPIFCQTFPGAPQIVAPRQYIEGQTVTLECTSTGGSPSPSVKWYVGNTLLDDTYESFGSNQVRNTYTFVVDLTQNFAVFECVVDNGVLQNPLSVTEFIQVYAPPDLPTLTGVTEVIEGTQVVHTCTSDGGAPKPTMSLRLGNTAITTGVQETAQLVTVNSAKYYTLKQEVTWTPTMADNGAILYCEVDQPETQFSEVVSLQITVKVALAINAPQLQYTGNIGSSITLQCVVTGQATSVIWLKNSVQLNINSNNRLSNGNVNNPSLTISNIQANDEGQYTCRATDGSRTVNTQPITFNTQSSPTVNIPQPTYTAQYGNPITLVCTVDAKPTQTSVYWEKDGQRINTGSSGYSGSSASTPSLTINFVRTNDQGQYRCFATNSVGTGQSSPTTLNVQGGLLTVTVPQTSYNSVLGASSLTISCTVSGSPTATSVAWTRTVGGQTTTINVASNSGKYSGSTVNTPSLTIRNIAQSDEGNYVCTATNIAGTSNSQSVFLDVTGSIPSVNILSPSYSVLYGNRITIECTVTANPAHTSVTWQKINNGIPSTINLGNTAKYSGGSVSTPSLTILNTVTADSGSYRCSATNAVGTGSSQDSTLTVTGGLLTVTIPQTSFNAVIGTGSITMDCSMSGTPQATSVTWTKTVGGQTTEIDMASNSGKYSGSTVSSPSLTIQNIEQDDEGDYVCTATNIVGTAKSQTAFFDVTGSVPTVNILSPNYSVLYGNKITIECTVTANPAHTTVSWDKIVNGQPKPVNLGNTSKYSGATVSTPSLTILNTVTDDSGQYRCSATNVVGIGSSQDSTLTVTGDLLTVTIQSTSFNAVIGSNSQTLGCTITGTPQATSVTWTKTVGGQTTDIDVASNSGKYSGSTVSSPSLIIQSIAQSDEGNYVCTATNVVGTSSSQAAFFDVTGSIPTVSILSSTYSVLYGDSITIECSITANPTHTSVTWQKINSGITSTINFGNSAKYSGGSVSTPSLTILNTVTTDSGSYRCSATNVVGTGSSQDTSLTVTGGLLTVTVSKTSFISVIGTNSLTLGCTISGTPQATSVTWTKTVGGQTTDIDVASNSGKYSGSTVSSPSLIIQNIAQSDEGNYICTATNIAGTSNSQAAFFDVTGSIPTVSILSSTYSVLYGDSITIECSITASPAHNSVTWQKINSGITSTINFGNSAKYSGGSKSTPSLTILNTVTTDSGSYRCSATNIVGTGSSQDTSLTVTGGFLTVTISQTSFNAVIGSNSLTLGCTITGTPQATSVTWTKTVGGQTTNIDVASNSGKYSGSTVSSPSLIIQNIAQSDEGNYVCTATNIAGTSSSQTAFFDVTGSIPSVNILSPSYSILYGNRITIECTINSNPPHTIVVWQKIVNGVPNILNLGNSAKYSGGTINTPSLTILNTVTEDSGTYRCTATNVVGTGSSQGTTLTVTGAALNVVIPLSIYRPDFADPVTLECRITGAPSATRVYWTFSQQGESAIEISTSSGKYSGSTVNNPSLTISNTDLTDEGTYYCWAVNAFDTTQSNPTTLDVIGNIPIVTIGSSAYQALVGNSITIGCTVTANPFAQSVSWEKEVSGQITQIGPSTNPTKYGGSTTVNPSLTINNLDFSDEGNYRCKATNIVGTGESTQGFLDIFGQPPTVVIALPNYSVSFGQSVTLTCTVTSNPAHTTVYWKRTINGVTTDINVNTQKYTGSTVNSPSLVVNNANLDDEGSYVCYAENSIGLGQSTATILDVIGNIPSVVVPQRQYNVDYGRSVTLTCTVTANPIHTVVYWNKIFGGVATRINVENSNNKYNGSTVTGPSLTINNLVLTDEASYICFATNGVGTGQSAPTSVNVAGGIPSVAVLSNSYSVVVTGTVTLQCVVTANPAHTVVQWQKVVGGQTTSVPVGGRLSGSRVNSPSLTISQTEFADEGNYICTATNAVGTGTSQRTFLDVTGTIPIVTVGQSAYNGDYGQSVTLVCSVSANPTETRVYWRRLQNGQMNDLSLQSGKYSGSTVGQPSLTVSGLDLSDEGFYQCFAENSVGTGSSQQTFLDVIGNIPIVRVLSNSYSVIVGNTVTLGCEVSATPRENNVYWRKIVNGSPQEIDLNNSKYSGSTVGQPSLTIRNAANSDEGNYICYATNIAGTGSSSQTFLDVEGSIPVVSIAQSSYQVNIGNPITLFCTVSATPPETNVYWTRINNQQAEEVVQMSNSNKYSGSTVSSPSLVIQNTDLNDIGSYRCYASNSVGTGKSNTTQLTVIGNIPIVTVAQSSYSVNYGGSVTLVCTVTAAPPHTTVFWRKIQGGQQVTMDVTTAKYSGSTVGQPSLTINNADSNDETFYVCYASNSVGTGQSSQTYLDVVGSLPIVRVVSNSYSVLLGQTATLECSITANPSATIVQWYKIVNQQQQIIDTSDSKYNTPTVNSPNLQINGAVGIDDGYYICTATNIVGTGQSAQTYLDVTGNVPTVTVSLPTYNTNIGATVTLGCTVVAQPAATTVFWKRLSSTGQTLDIDINSSRYDGSSINSPSLIIYNPQLNDEGNYVCFATNAIGTGQSSQTFLDVTGNIPTVNVLKSLYSVNIGQTITLECTVTASPAHTTVYWQKVLNGVATTISSTTSNKYSGSTVNAPSLTLSNAEASDEAYYICFATNEVGTGQSAQTYLDVVGGIPIVNIGSTSYSVNYGNSITLVCTVTSNPVHTSVTWNKIQNGVSTTISVNSGKYSGGTVSQPSLVINNAGNSDEAFYICSATNSVGKGQSSQTYLDVVGAIPVVQILSNYYSVEIGNSVKVECQIQSDPAYNSVQWQRVENGVPRNLDVSNSQKYFGGTRNTPSLTIQNTDDSDEGYYICTATNAVGTGSSSQSYVDITGSILSVTVPQPQYSVNYGQSVQLVCTVSGNPSATSVYWIKSKGGQSTTITSNSNSNKYSGVTLNTPSLTIRNADASDQAVYTCFAENAIGRGQSQQTQLQVIGSVPSVTIGQGYTVNLGSSVTIQCTVFATPSATIVSWKKINAAGVETIIDLSSNSNKYTGGSVNIPSLTVLNAVDSDEAYYVCSATNAAGTGTSSQSYLDVLGSIPVVTIPQPQYSLTVGNNIVLECTVDANPAHTNVMWRKIVNGQPTEITIGTRFSGSTVSNPSLTINNAQSSDAGYYVCYASNSVGTGQSAQTYLNVVGSIPVVTVLSTSYSVNIDNSITLQCTVSASPPATTVMWQRIVNNQAVNVDMADSRYAGSSITNPSLVISNARGTDEGFYICMASNSVGTGRSQQTFLDVVGSIPSVTVPVPNYTVNRGASVTLECQYTANPAATSVTWERILNGQAIDISISASQNKYSGSTTSSPSLIVNNAEESDQASYICKVTNNIGTGISSATALDVVGNIPIVVAPKLAYSVNIGESVTLTCQVTADPKHTTVQWRKIIGGTSTNIVVANSNGKYGGSSVDSPSLVINNAAFSDQGTYVCFATNSVGTGQSTQVVVAVAGSVPSVTLSQTSFSGNYGEAITLGCIISSNPVYTSVYWQKTVAGTDPITIDLTNTDKYSGSTVTDPDLTIKNLGSGDIATYVCFAANSVGTGRSNSSPLNVVGNVPQVRISQTTYPINIGNTVTIDCSVVASPSHTTVYWTRQVGSNTPETISVTGASSTKYGGATVVSPSLIIYNVDENDQATYVCHATNIVGTGKSSQAFLDVVGNVPTVTASTVQSTRVGNSVTIQCVVISNPAALDIVWSKYINNQPTPIDITNNNRLTGGTTSNPSLVINPVEQDDEGNYICQARNEVGTGSSNQVYLDITGDPPTQISINPTKIVIEEGQTIMATCLAIGSPEPTYSWYKENSNTMIATGSILEINNAPRSAAGTYTCRATNNYGSNEATVIVDVQYKPLVTISSSISSFDGKGTQSINIPCSYMSNPAATSVFWTKFTPVEGTNSGNTVLVDIDGSKYQGGNLNSPSLTIYNLASSDQGSYRCSATNIIGQGDSNYVTLAVDMNAAPSYIRIIPSQVVIEEGNTYTLTCEADGVPQPKFEWYYKDVKVKEGYQLTIQNAVYANNDGLHTCKASNIVGSKQATVDVDVKYPPISAVVDDKFFTYLDQPVTLRCDTDANPSATAWTWEYNGFNLDYNGKTYLVDMDSTSDIGLYYCIAYNEVGQSSKIEFAVELATPSTPSPKIVETVVSGSLTGGEIAAIILAVLFGILLLVILIVCCVAQGCCRRKKAEKRYVEREVVREAVPIRTETIRTEAIPYVKEPSVVSVREMTPRITYVDDSYRYMTAPTTRPYYLPVVEATYDDEEYRKRHKKKKRSKRYQDDLARDDHIYLEERVVGSVRGSTKGEEIITGPEMYFEAE